jgi:hypothetical protein
MLVVLDSLAFCIVIILQLSYVKLPLRVVAKIQDLGTLPDYILNIYVLNSDIANIRLTAEQICVLVKL